MAKSTTQLLDELHAHLETMQTDRPIETGIALIWYEERHELSLERIKHAYRLHQTHSEHTSN
jgi:hypothetical protein